MMSIYRNLNFAKRGGGPITLHLELHLFYTLWSMKMPRKIHNTKTSQTSLGAIKSNFLQQEFLYLTSIKQQGRRSWYKSFRYNISFYYSFFQLYVWHFICLRRHIILLLKTSVEFWTPLEFWRKYSINFKVYAKDAFNFFFSFPTIWKLIFRNECVIKKNNKGLYRWYNISWILFIKGIWFFINVFQNTPD